MNMGSVEIALKGEVLRLLPQKAIYMPQRKIILLSDTHFGKVMHFRKSGIAVPRDVIGKNWEKLIYLLDHYDLDRFLLLGDLFHSEYNSEWEEFQEIIQQYSDISFELILGNHDIMEPSRYENLLLRHTLNLGPFICTHEPIEEATDQYNLCGHIHPGIRLRGQAKQSMRLPCFFFGKNQAILPAFGAFTGLKTMKAGKNDQIYVIADNRVVPVH